MNADDQLSLLHTIADAASTLLASLEGTTDEPLLAADLTTIANLAQGYINQLTPRAASTNVLFAEPPAQQQAAPAPQQEEAQVVEPANPTTDQPANPPPDQPANPPPA